MLAEDANSRLKSDCCSGRSMLLPDPTSSSRLRGSAAVCLPVPGRCTSAHPHPNSPAVRGGNADRLEGEKRRPALAVALPGAWCRHNNIWRRRRRLRSAAAASDGTEPKSSFWRSWGTVSSPGAPAVVIYDGRLASVTAPRHSTREERWRDNECVCASWHFADTLDSS